MAGSLRDPYSMLGVDPAAMGGDIPAPVPGATDPSIQANLDREGGEFGRGLRSSGIQTFQAAPQALLGLGAMGVGMPDFGHRMLGNAHEAMRRAAESAPFTGSYKDVHDLKSAGNYIAGKTGELAPYLGLSVLGPEVGAAAMGITGAGGQVAGHITPEGGLDVDPGKLGVAALGTGAAQAALGAVPLGRLMEGATQGAVKGALGHAATMGAVSPVMTGAEQASETFLNPSRDKSHDTEQMIESAIGGAAGMLGPGALSGKLAKIAARLPKPDVTPEPIKDPEVLQQKLLEYKGRAEAATDPKEKSFYSDLADAFKKKIDELAPTAKDTFRDLLQKGQEAADDYRKSGDLRTYLGRILSDPTATPERTDSQILRTWATEGTPDQLRTKREEAAKVAAKYVPDILRDPDVPPEVKRFVSEQPFPLGASGLVADWLDNKTAAKNKSFFKETGDKINAAIAGFRAARDAGKGKRSEEAPDRTELEDKAWANLKPEYQTPDGKEMVMRVARLAATILGSEEKPSPRDILRYGIANIADDIFVDPKKALETLGIEMSRRTAVQDAADPNSFLIKSLSPGAKRELDQMPASTVKQIGKVIEDFVTQGLKGDVTRTKDEAENAKAKFADSLAGVFGSPELAQKVIDHYQARYEKDLGGKEVYSAPRKDASGAHTLTGDARDVYGGAADQADEHGKEVDTPEAQYVYKDRARGRGFSLRDALAKVSELRKAPESGGFADTTEFSVQSMLDHVNETGQGIKIAAQKLYNDYKRQIEEDRRHKNEKVQGTGSTRGARANAMERWLKNDVPGMSAEQFLSKHHVIKAEASEANDLVATHADLQKMRTGLSIKESTDPNIKEQQRAARFDAYFHEGDKLRKETFDADSVWRTWSDKMGKPGVWSPETFKEGLAAIMGRSDFAKLDRFGDDTVINKELGLRYSDLKPDPKMGELFKKHKDLLQRLENYAELAKRSDINPDQLAEVKAKFLKGLDGRMRDLVQERLDRIDEEKKGDFASTMAEGNRDTDPLLNLLDEEPKETLKPEDELKTRMNEQLGEGRAGSWGGGAQGKYGEPPPKVVKGALEGETKMPEWMAPLTAEEKAKIHNPKAELNPKDTRSPEQKLTAKTADLVSGVGSERRPAGQVKGAELPDAYTGLNPADIDKQTGVVRKPLGDLVEEAKDLGSGIKRSDMGVDLGKLYDTIQSNMKLLRELGEQKNIDRILDDYNDGTSKSWSRIAKALEAVLAKHPGYGEANKLIKDLSNPLKGAEDIDPVKESMQRPGGKEMSDAEKQTIRDDYARMFGKHVRAEFKKEFGWSGEWDESKHTATISTLAMDPRSTGWHEAMHAFMSLLTKGPTERRMREQLLRAAESAPILRQLQTLLKGHDAALAQLKNDREERLSYMFQFYKSGALKLGPDTKTIFNKIMDFVRAITGTVSSYQQAARYMDALYEGKFSDPSVAAQVIHDLKIETLADKLKRTTGPLARWADVIFTATGDRLKNTGVDAFREIAQKFHRGAGEEQGGNGMLQRRQQMMGKFLNEYQNIVGNMSQVELKKTLDGMRGGSQNAQIRALLDKIHDYMLSAGVKRTELDPKGHIIEHPLGFRKNYFPRVYDKDATMRDMDGFKKDMMQKNPGMTSEMAQNLYDHITKGTGYGELSDNEHQPGYTPFNQAVNERKIPNVGDKWLSQDMHKIMSTYIFQATHRAEYTRDFGNSGHVIEALLRRAADKEGATLDELKMARNAVKAYEGTIGADMNPTMRKFMAGVMVYENVAVLPFALFGSLTDPLGQLVRGGDFKDVWHAYGEGISGLAKDLLRRKEKGQDFDMARTLGLIDNANMLENFGELYNGMYMGPWLRKINDAFFRWNGLEGWTQRMRTSAMVASERFILKHSQNVDPENSARYMEELGLSKSDVKKLPDGRIAKTQEQGLTADQERRVQQAIFKWVDGAVVRPNAAHRPIWGSDPHFSLIFHLKQFGYSQHAVINQRVGHEWEHGNYMPALALAVYAPMMEASDWAQDILAGHGIASGTAGLYRAVARSGMMGKGQFGLDALMDPAYGGIPGQSFLGPAANHILYAAGTAAGAPRHDASTLLWRSIPGGPAIRGATGQ